MRRTFVVALLLLATPVIRAADDAETLATAIEAAGCLECHGERQQKGGLRLDSVDGVLEVVVPRAAPDSELFRRIALPIGHEDRMPPEGPGFDESQILATLRWINSGADSDKLAAPLEWIAGGSAKQSLALAAIEVATGARIVSLGRAREAGLRVDFSRASGGRIADHLEPLTAIADRVVELSLAGCDITGETLSSLPALPRLERLHLERTRIDDAGVEHFLETSGGLRYVNLHSTSVGSPVLESLLTLPHLERLVLFDTGVDDNALAEFAASRPKVVVTGRLALPAQAFPDGGPRKILAADASKKRIALLQETDIGGGDLIWEHAIDEIHDLQLLDDGHILFQETWTRIVEVDPETDAVVWEYDAATEHREADDGPVEVHSFQRLEDGTTLIAESGPARLIEVGRDHTLLRVIPLVIDAPHPHHDTRLVRRTANETYLVAHERDGKVREYDRAGRVIWSYEVPLFGKERRDGHGLDAWGNQLFSAVRLASGNTLIATGNGHGVIEVTPGGEIAWQVAQDDIEGVRLAWVTTLQVLPSGNILLGNCHAGPEQPQIIEIDRAKQRVWSWRDFDRFGNALSNSWIVEDGQRR